MDSMLFTMVVRAGAWQIASRASFDACIAFYHLLPSTMSTVHMQGFIAGKRKLRTRTNWILVVRLGVYSLQWQMWSGVYLWTGRAPGTLWWPNSRMQQIPHFDESLAHGHPLCPLRRLFYLSTLDPRSSKALKRPWKLFRITIGRYDETNDTLSARYCPVSPYNITSAELTRHAGAFRRS